MMNIFSCHHVSHNDFLQTSKDAPLVSQNLSLHERKGTKKRRKKKPTLNEKLIDSTTVYTSSSSTTSRTGRGTDKGSAAVEPYSISMLLQFSTGGRTYAGIQAWIQARQ